MDFLRQINGVAAETAATQSEEFRWRGEDERQERIRRVELTKLVKVWINITEGFNILETLCLNAMVFSMSVRIKMFVVVIFG